MIILINKGKNNMAITQESWDKTKSEYLIIFQNIFGDTMELKEASSLPGPMGQFIYEFYYIPTKMQILFESDRGVFVIYINDEEGYGTNLYHIHAHYNQTSAKNIRAAAALLKRVLQENQFNLYKHEDGKLLTKEAKNKETIKEPYKENKITKKGLDKQAIIKEYQEKKKVNIIGYIPVFGLLLAILFLPETGFSGILQEAFTISLFFIVAIYIIYKLFHKQKNNKQALILGVLTSLLLISFSSWNLYKLSYDLINGPKTIHLTSLSRYHFIGLRGLISERFSLEGYDEQGNWYSFPISNDEYHQLETIQEITVTCYPKSERILEFMTNN